MLGSEFMQFVCCSTSTVLMWHNLPSALISMLFIIDACFDGNRRDILFCFVLCCVRSETYCSPRVTFSVLLRPVNTVVAARLVHDSDDQLLSFLSFVKAAQIRYNEPPLCQRVFPVLFSRLDDAPSMRGINLMGVDPFY